MKLYSIVTGTTSEIASTFAVPTIPSPLAVIVLILALVAGASLRAVSLISTEV